MKNEKYFKNYKAYIKKIKSVCIRELDKADVYLFGSVLEGKYLPSSDIDVIIVSENMPVIVTDRSKIKTKIWKAIGLLSPFELHMVTPKEFEWYKKFIKKMKAF